MKVTAKNQISYSTHMVCSVNLFQSGRDGMIFGRRIYLRGKLLIMNKEQAYLFRVNVPISQFTLSYITEKDCCTSVQRSFDLEKFLHT